VSFDDQIAGSYGRVVFDVSEPDAIEERQIRSHDQVGIEAWRGDAHRHLATFEQQPDPSSARSREVELENRTPAWQQLAVDALVNFPDQQTGVKFLRLRVTERTAYILRVRQLAVGIAKAYVGESAPKVES